MIQKRDLYNFFPVLPAVPIIILVAVGDIYGVREVLPCEEPSNPYLM